MKIDSKTENQFDRIICFLTIGVFIMLTIAKIFLASQLSLFGDDESFYWQCAQHPSLAYSDHPFMTSFLILSGTKLLGNTYLGVRMIFLIMGSFIPFLIFIMARSLVGKRDAFYAAAMSMGLPLLGCMGVLAMPDVPLLFFWIISLAAFERAVRTENIWPWIVAGISIAAGINTHYRFSVFIACAGAYLLLTKTGRRQWKKFGLWIAILIAGAGLLPVVWFNVTHDFAPIHFQFVNRHPGIFQPMAFLQPLKQALTVTPILYAFFILGLIKILKRSVQGDNKSALLVSFAVVPLAGYFILGLWADQKHTNVHWPLVGYLPLLVVLPGVIRDFVHLSAKNWRQSSKYVIAASAPVLGILGTLILLGYFAIAVWPHTFNFAFKTFERTAPYDFTGWRELRYKTESSLQKLYKATVTVFATENI
jgi:4-amino-4-deoxy-L-arabinose transferase-like glycosyltransferase